jgi:hypothetical protein
MNTKLIAAAEALADKTQAAENAYNALQFAQAALALVQAATSLHYAEQPTQSPIPAGGTD